MSAVLLLTRDLMIASQAEGAAIRHDLTLHLAAPAQAPGHLARLQPVLVIVDLASVSGDVAEAIGSLRKQAGDSTQILAFGPHVHQERLQAAKRAGCDQTVTRGQFHAQMDRLFAESTR